MRQGVARNIDTWNEARSPARQQKESNKTRRTVVAARFDAVCVWVRNARFELSFFLLALHDSSVGNSWFLFSHPSLFYVFPVPLNDAFFCSPCRFWNNLFWSKPNKQPKKKQTGKINIICVLGNKMVWTCCCTTLKSRLQQHTHTRTYTKKTLFGCSSTLMLAKKEKKHWEREALSLFYCCLPV